MTEVVIGEKMWDHFDYNIMLWNDRGKGRAKIIWYRRRASSKDERSHNSLHIARIVMGAHLIGFLINKCYGTARLIPYVMLANTIRGNGCLGEDRYDEVVVYEKRTNTQVNATRMDPADAPVQEND